MLSRHIIICFFASLLTHFKAQQSLSLGAGVGLMEMVHATVRYQVKNIKVAIAAGGFPQGVVGLSADLYAHFGKRSEISLLPSFFLRGGVSRTIENGYKNTF